MLPPNFPQNGLECVLSQIDKSIIAVFPYVVTEIAAVKISQEPI